MPRELTERLIHLLPPALRRVVVYGFVGVAVSVFYSLAIVACVFLLDPIRPTVASIVAFVITLPIAYLAHSRVSFSDRLHDKAEPLRFVLSTAANLVVAVGGMYWITEIADRSYLLGIAWNWLVIPAMNFASYMLWVFRSSRKTRKEL